MSGGFFRGTSADQDTRFSNKQAKLLKSQKFPPELDHLVDMSKVKMDVVKPWIATRVTELLGFEDEVLINFIYGLLDGKDINGKEVQIQITGFMEKNTGKFMKELWGLLLSAQKNASGVPQQFLDAKEEEIRKKKVETDRITHEIQKKKELEQEKQKKLDEEANNLKAVDGASNIVPEHSTLQTEEDIGSGERNGLRKKRRSPRSPRSVDHSSSPDGITRSRSISKSFSNSRSYSDDRDKSRSISRSPQSRGRSILPDKRYRSPRKRSLSPRRKYSPRRRWSPIRRRSPLSRRRSPPYSWRRSPSPWRRRSPSPRRRRSPSPRSRRSPSPMLRRSPALRRRKSPTPVRRKSPTPVRRRSPNPVRRRSPSPMRRRSPPPMRRRSPSPLRRRSPSPMRRRSPITVRRRSPSPLRYRSPSPLRRRSPSPVRRRSPRQRRRSPLRSPRSGSPYRSRSPVYHSRRSLSRDHDVRTNGVGSRKYHDDYISERIRGKRSPSWIPEREGVERFGQGQKRPISLRSPQRVPRDRSDAGREMPVSMPSREISPSQSGSSLHTGKSSPSEDRSPSEGAVRNTHDRINRADSASPVRLTRHLEDSRGTVREDGAHYSRVDGVQRTISPQRHSAHSPVAGHRNISTKPSHHQEYFPEKLAGLPLGEAKHWLDGTEISKKDRDRKSEKASLRINRPLTPTRNSSQIMEVVEYGPGKVEVKGLSPDNACSEHPSAKQRDSSSPERTHKSRSRDYNVDEMKDTRARNVVVSGFEETENLRKSMKKAPSFSTNRTENDSDSETVKNKSKDIERRKHKRHDRHHVASEDDTSYDSHVDERKEAKRRRKEEKKLRKEEKRRRREERHRRREERRAGKLKAKTMYPMNPPSDVEKNRSVADDSDDHIAPKIDYHPSDTEETESEQQKKLEIELRKKALESLRAKKAIIP